MEEVVNATLELKNETDAVNGTKIPATPEGAAVAYGSLLIMALFPIVLGSFRSVKSAGGQQSESMTGKDAAIFPFIASGFLFGIYIIFQVFSKEYINLLLTVYFFFLGVMALSHLCGPVIAKFLPASFPNADYHLLLTRGKTTEDSENLIDYKFDHKEIVSLVLCGLVGVWYLVKKHWIANNLFGLAFAVSGVEILQLNAVSTGCILLGGLFFYDVFWVFGTNVMVTVAKSFDAPIKLIFPQDLLEKGINADNFAMLGLGDIVIPGIFIALLLRFDISLKRNSKLYFYSSFIAYILGLVTTIVVMHVFKHAQPALLYLVPYCVATPIFVALIKGDLSEMFKYKSETSADREKDKEKDNETKDGKKDK